jgi:poly(3-hydroxybutyrate) depolymerase
MRTLVAVISVSITGCEANEASTVDASSADTVGATDGSVSTGCVAAGAPTGVADLMITVAGVERRYIRYVPASYDPTTPYPLIFAWHGRTGNGMLARQYFGIEAATSAQAIIVYPFGLPVTADPADTGWVLTANGRDIALFDAIQQAIASQYCIGRTYSTGHSFGGYMSNAVACYRGGTSPSAVRAIAPVAGGGPFGTCSGGAVSAVVIHGMNDMVVPFAEGDAAHTTWRTRAGCEATSMPIMPAPCVADDGCDNGLAVRFCVHQATTANGHGWPSFAAAAAWQLFQDSP